MKKFKYGIFVVLLFLISGCGPVISLNSFYSAKDKISDDTFLGKWKVVKEETDSTDKEVKPIENEIWIVSKDEQTDSYELDASFEGYKILLTATLFKINNVYLLDLYPKQIVYPQNDSQDEDKLSAFLGIHLFPVHTVSKITFTEKDMTLEPLDEEWVKDQILRKKFDLSYGVSENDTILLTAEPEDIRDYLTKHLDQAFSNGQVYKFERVK